MFDPEEDLHDDNASVWTNTRTITLRLVRRTEDIDHRVEGVRRHIVTATEAEESGGAYIARDAVFNIPADSLLADVADPEIGYLIIDLDDRNKQWTILQVDEASQSSRWRCACRNLALTDGLSDTIEIWSPTNRKDDAGGNVGEFLPKYMGVQAKVQEITGTDVEEGGRDGTALEYRITVGRRLYVDSNDQLRWLKPGEPPTILNIVSHEGADQLARLQVITAKRGMW